jgi:hypothetical protein
MLQREREREILPLKQHTSGLMLISKMYLKVKFCYVNKECNLHIVTGTYNPCKKPKTSPKIQK